jgi:RNA polymerase sigma factor (sigma-70 family)
MPPAGSPLGSEELLAHAGFLRALARGLCTDDARADDLVQDTFVAALERPPVERGALRGWLATVARHLAANRARAEARRDAREAHVGRPEGHEPEHTALERLELSRRLAEAVLDLGEPYRTAIYLRYHEGLSPREIAQRLGVPVKTVKTRLARALADLRQRMDERSQGRGTWMPALLALAWPRGSVPAAAAPLAVTLAGGLAVKKLALAALVVALIAVTWQVVRVELVSPRAGEGASVSPSLAKTPISVASAATIERAAPAAEPREPLPAVAPAAPATTGDLTVEVVWKDGGEPVAGLCIDVWCLDDPAPRRNRSHALTNREGIVRYRDLPVGRARLFAATGCGDDAEVIAGTDTTKRFELESGFTIDGRVVDPQGGPVANAEIWVQQGAAIQAEFNHAVERSGADGRFRLRGLTDHISFGARAAGWQPSLMFEASELPVGPNGAREVTLELRKPGGGAAGRVLDPDGGPAAGALVLVGKQGGFTVDLPTGLRALEPRPALLTANERGEFALLDHLAPGTHDVYVCARGFPIWTGSVDVTEGSKAWIEVQLARPARIAGRVVEGGERPVAEAEVTSSREMGVEQFSDPFEPPRATTNAQGLFLLDWVAPGEQELTARVHNDERRGRARASLTLEPGETRQVELALDVGEAIRGRVVDGEGKPLAGWKVYGKSEGMVEDAKAGVIRFLDLRRMDSSDEQGRFVLANPVHPGSTQHNPMTISVAAPGQIPIPPRAEVKGVMPGTQDVELVVENAAVEPAILRGRLVGADGRVPQDVMLTVWEHTQNNSGLRAEVDPVTGQFEFASNLPGQFDVRVLRGGNTLVNSGPHELIAGQTTDIGRIELSMPGKVEVILPGLPPEFAKHTRVNLTSSWAADEELEREGDAYRSRPVAPGRWVLHVDCEAWFVPDREVEVQSGATARLELAGVQAFEVDLAFELADPSAKWTQVEVEIRDASDTVVRRGGPWPPERLHGSELRYYGLGLPVGRYTAHARTDGGQEGFGTLEISDPLSARGPHRFPLR